MQRRRAIRHHLGTLAMMFLTVATVAAISAPARALAPDVPSDFNGDGYADLAISTLFEPSEDGTPWVGGVNVLYGSDLGLSAEGDELFTADSPGIAGSGRKEGLFGGYLMPGDFDGDGYDDLAVGASGASVRGHSDAGAVIVVYGSADGLAGAGSRESVQWTLDSPDVPGGPANGDRFGYQLASGDANGDGFDELAVGIAHRDMGPDEDAGAVLVLPGSAAGITGVDSVLWSPLVAGVPGSAAPRAEFGLAIRMGDLDGNGYDDLAIGSPFAQVNGIKQAGTVTVLYSTAAGLGTEGAQRWDATASDLPSGAHPTARFGFALGIADFGNGTQDDLAIGAITDTVRGTLGAGAVYVLYGSSSRLTDTGVQRWTEETDGIVGRPAFDDEFGDALAVGDMGNGPEADLVIGVVKDSVDGRDDAGSFRVLYGSADGLTVAGAKAWTQDSPGIPERAEPRDYFGYEVYSSDFNGDGVADLASSAAYERLTEPRSGVVNVIYGTLDGLGPASAQIWSQDSPGVLGRADAYEYFGFSVG